MALSNLPFYPQGLISSPTQFTNSTSTTVPTQILAAQANGGVKVNRILVSSTDTSARDLQLFFNVSATNYALVTISIPATAGTVNSIPAVELISALSAGTALLPASYDSNGNKFLYLDTVTSLTAEPLTTITAGKVINIIVIGEKY